MQYSEEWKTLFPISWVHAPPLLTQNSSLGPLFFNPVPQSLSLLFSSSDLSPPVLPSLSGVPSNSNNILRRNRLEPLYCPNNQVIIFFPTGSNFDCVGFLVLSVREKDSKLVVGSSSAASVYTSQITFAHQIILLTACPISDSSFHGEGSSASVGFLLACNSYAANWFSVRISANSSDSNKPSLVFMGSKKFTSSAVASACWNPHFPGECVVLLENGALFLFDMDSSLDTRFRGKRIRITWDELGESAGTGWFSCEFSWHPRILVVANAKAIYVVDVRYGKCQQTCLLRIILPGVTDLFAKDRFVLFSKAGSEGFLYTVATQQWLLLCDVRKPLMPVLSWAHHLHEPHYMTVLPLSDLRSMPHDKLAGACAVILGSFWNKEFSFFCYGHPHPATTSSSSSDLSDFSNSFYAWELPSQFLLSGQSANCLLKEEFAKDDIPEWIEWQQKQALVLGFCILTNNISSLLPNPGEHGGFTLVRLISTGKLESQQYCASWETARIVATEHREIISLKDSLLCSMGEEKYKFPRRFRYIKLENLYDYFDDNFAESMSKKFRNSGATGGLKKFSNEHSKKFTSDNLNPLGSGPSMSDMSVADVFGDVNMPTSVYEVNSRMMWTKSPLNLLEVAFPKYSEVCKVNQKVSPEFPAISPGNQAPPFFLRNPSHCRSTKVRRGGDFVGPVIPLPALTVLKEVSRRDNFSVEEVNVISSEDIVTPQCEYVMRLTKEIRSLNAGYKQGNTHAVSLKQDWDEPWVNSSGSRPFFSYKPSAFLDETEDDNSSVLGEKFSTIVAKVAEDGGDFFDDLCPMDLKFDSCSKNQESSNEELSAYKLLKKQFSQWQNGFIPYQNLHKQIQEQKLLSRP